MQWLCTPVVRITRIIDDQPATYAREAGIDLESHATPEGSLPAVHVGSRFRQRRGRLPDVLVPSRARGPSGAHASRLARLPEAQQLRV